MYLACYTLQEIADETGYKIGGDLSNLIKTFEDLDSCPKSQKNLADFQDTEFDAPIYNIWSFWKENK